MVWADDSRGAEHSYQIYARGMVADGRQRFYPFTVNQDAAGDQRTPAVASTADGRFFVAWKDTRNDAGDIIVRGFKPDGSQLFAEVLVHSPTLPSTQDSPDIAASDSGFVVVFRSGNTIRARSFRADGVAIDAAPQTVANVAGAGAPSVAAAPDGNAVVAWRHGARSIRMKRFVIGSAIPAIATAVKSVSAPGTLDEPSVDVAAGGEAIIAWEDDTDGNGSRQIHRAFFDDAGTMIGATATVNKNSRGQQTDPSVAIATVGTGPRAAIRWVVSWTDNLDGNNYTQILAKGGSFPRRIIPVPPLRPPVRPPGLEQMR